MNSYDRKYGFKSSDEAIKSFHHQRIMFAIKDHDLYIADRGISDSHAVWFEKLGWITPENDHLMEEITRGYVDSSGIYAYCGFNFRTTGKVEADVRQHIAAIVEKTGTSDGTRIYVGLFPTSEKSGWKPIKDLGTVKDMNKKIVG